MQSLLSEDARHAQSPIILGGDFNTNDQSQTYRLVNQYLRNSHWEVGCGFGFTYPTPESIFGMDLPIPALIRIDHIFYSDDFIAIRARTLTDSGGSDHYPVMAELVQNLK
jgi:endonuclease/exonuclease/phosphatase family metal-dependent hydrolase